MVAAPAGPAEATSIDLVFPELAGEDARSVLEEISTGIASALPGVGSAAELARGFAEREALGSTGLGGGLAVPHCKLAGVGRARVAVGIHGRGIDFGAPDGAPVRVFLALISPPSSPAAHLALLAAIARWAKVPGRVDELARAGGKREILTIVEPVVAPATGERTAR